MGYAALQHFPKGKGGGEEVLAPVRGTGKLLVFTSSLGYAALQHEKRLSESARVSE